jgi:hypothetical protein
VIVFAGIAARVIALDRLPGINGDEAWFGVNVEEFLGGGTPFWRTPVGNPLNPFHSGPLLAVSLVMDPALLLLRVPAALWGCLSVALAYPLLSPSIGARAALYTTAFVAFSATAVSQARLGWDPSATPLASLLSVACALANRPVAAALAAVAALIVHPTNIFLMPIVAAAWAPHAVDRYARLTRDARRTAVAAALAAVIVALAIGVPIATAVARSGRLPSLEIMSNRLMSPAALRETAEGVVQLFSGVTAATAIAAHSSRTLSVAAGTIAVLSFLVPLVVCWQSLGHERPQRARWLLAGIAASIVAFHLIAGPDMLKPSFERYAMFLVVPLAVACALLCDALTARSRFVGLAITAITCAMLVVVLVRGYFLPLVVYGGASHHTYRTGAVEPKAAAFAFIREHSAGAGVGTVFAENWWLYWPIRYLASADRDRLHVELVENEWALSLRPAGTNAPVYRQAPDRVYVVVFDGGALWSRLQDGAQRLFTAVDPAARPILHVFAIMAADARPILGAAPWESSPR